MNSLSDKLTTRDGRAPSVWRSVSMASSWLVIALSATVVLGWIIGSAALTSWVSSVTPMKISGALTFLTAGLALLRLSVRQTMEVSDRRWMKTAAGVAFIAGFSGVVSGILGRIRADSVDLTPDLARQIAFDPLIIPLASGVSFVLAGFALWFLQNDWDSSRSRASAWSLASAANALLAALGYAYGVEVYYNEQTYVPMPLPAAVLFLLLTVTIITAQSTGGLLTAFLSTTSTARYARRILPAAVLVPFVLGWVHIRITRSGAIDPAFALSIEVLLIIVILSTLILGMVLSFHLRDERERKLERERDGEAERRHVIWDLSRDLMMVANLDGSFVDVNPAWTSTLGWSREELLSRPCEEFLHRDDRARTEAELRRLPETGSSLLFTNRYRTKDGNYRTLQWHTAVRREAGEIVGVARDVTDTVRASEELLDLNRELESRVRLRTIALETANRELESFSYAVSHDLRAPLRAIEGFSRMVIERHAQELPDQGQHYLERVRVAADRMGQIIDGLLVLSRLSRGELRIEKVDLSEIAGEIEDDLRAADDRDTRVTIEPEMIVHGDRRLLRSLLQNLISNAWKFTERTERALIEIGSLQRGPDRVFFVRDNGAGFDQKHSEKLFKPFQRLHSTDEFEGTGLGLATVRRVVHRHGGAAWAEGEVGNGATFWFSLPSAGHEKLEPSGIVSGAGPRDNELHTTGPVRRTQPAKELG